MDHEKVLGEHKFPTYEELKTGLIRLIDEGKISREDAARLLPELRESEEEMTRKKAIAILKQQRDYWSYDGPIDKFPPATPRKDLVDVIDVALSYLEKQKEQKPEIKYVYPKFRKGDVIEPITPNGSFTPVRVIDIYDGSYSCRSDDDKAYLSLPIKQEDEYRLVEQKPAWSEVELLFRGEKVTVKRPFYRDDKGRGYSTTEQDEEVAWNALRAWCEKKGISLYDLYPKADWSEEDEKQLDDIISIIRGAYEHGITISETRHRNAYFWLNNLRPSWKPSEEQMDALKELIDDANRAGWVTPGATELYEQLKKL